MYSTWDGFEADKLASIWLIRRHIAPGAQILIYPQGGEIDRGITFDTPYAEIRRSFSQSTFEALLVHYGIQDTRLQLMARLIHDLEINVWERKVYKKSGEIQVFVLKLLDRSPDQAALMETAERYFDELYRDMPDTLERN